MLNRILAKLLQPTSFFWYSSILLVSIGADRISKTWAINALAKADKPIIPGLTLTLSINHGVSWNMFSTTTVNGTRCLIAFILLVLVAFIIHAIIQYRQRVGLIPEFLVFAGAIGNLIDRFIYGGVIDFISLYCGNWQTFNIADCSIFIGVALIFVRSLCDNSAN